MAGCIMKMLGPWFIRELLWFHRQIIWHALIPRGDVLWFCQYTFVCSLCIMASWSLLKVHKYVILFIGKSGDDEHLLWDPSRLPESAGLYLKM